MGRDVECNGMKYTILGYKMLDLGMRYSKQSANIVRAQKIYIVLRGLNDLHQIKWVPTAEFNALYKLMEDDYNG